MFTIAICLVTVCLPLGHAATEQDVNGCLALSENVPEYNTCTCHHQGNERQIHEISVIECVDRHFDEATARRMLNATSQYMLNVEKIVFTGNNIYHLYPHVLGNLKHRSLWDLKILNLSNNNIKEISGKAFHSAPELKTLILDDNEWQVSDKTPRIFYSFMELRSLSLNFAFSTSDQKAANIQVENLSDVFEGSEMYWLEELYLERNNLEYVNAKIFQSLPSLRKVSLRDNVIMRSRGLFNATCHEVTYAFNFDEVSHRIEEKCYLQEMDLYNNSLRYIDTDFINELLRNNNFTSLNIHSNPLVCDCNMKPFVEMIMTDDTVKQILVDFDSLTCSVPGKKGQVLLSSVKLKDMCNFGKSGMEKSTNAASVVITILLVVLALLLVIVGVYHRQTVLKKGGEMVMCARDQCCPRKYKYHGVSV